MLALQATDMNGKGYLEPGAHWGTVAGTRTLSKDVNRLLKDETTFQMRSQPPDVGVSRMSAGCLQAALDGRYP